MIFVASDGYILSVLRPYLAVDRNSNAKITVHMLKSNAEFFVHIDWFHEGDVRIVDRGFRDATDLLEQFGTMSQMPHVLARS